MEALNRLFFSPLLPVLIAGLGPVVLSFAHPTRTRPLHLRIAAVSILAAAFCALIGLAFMPGVPLYAWDWQPFPRFAFQMLWIKVSWNWHIALLVGALGLVGLLLAGQNQDVPLSPAEKFFHSRFLALNLATIGAAWLLVHSANMLALVFMWMVLDVIMVIRQTLAMHQHETVQHDYSLVYHRALGLGVLGTLVLLVGLFPAGINGPGQMLIGALLPVESVYALLLAAALRAGAYPLHLWLLPSSLMRLSVAERIFSHMLPALTGIWLLGLALDLSPLHPEVLANAAPWMIGAFCLAALSCCLVQSSSLRHSFVLVAAVTQIGMLGGLSGTQGAYALVTPTAAFAWGGALWLIADRLPGGRRAAVLRGLGAAGLLGWPLTPAATAFGNGFALDGRAAGASLLVLGGAACFSAGLWLPAVQGAASGAALAPSAQRRFAVGALMLVCPLAVFGLDPHLLYRIAEFNAPDASAPFPGRLLADWPRMSAYWLATGIGGWGLAWLRVRTQGAASDAQLSLPGLLSLEWLSSGMQFGATRLSLAWSRMLAVTEGAGAVGWILILLLLLWTALR